MSSMFPPIFGGVCPPRIIYSNLKFILHGQQALGSVILPLHDDDFRNADKLKAEKRHTFNVTHV